jgi:CxxC motif-containing protein
MKEMTCIVCPVGCHLSIDDALKVIGNRCPRGERYGIDEMTQPKRMLTSTVRTLYNHHPRLSVKSRTALPKGLIFEAISVLDSVIIDKNVKIGDVIVSNIMNTGVDMIATSELSIDTINGRNQ